MNTCEVTSGVAANVDLGRYSTYHGHVKTITVAQLRQNPTAALEDIESGESYVVTRHRHPIARLVPVDTATVVVTPARGGEPSRLSDRPRAALHTYEETESLLEEMSSDG